MKKVLFFIAPGNEATEFIATYDVLLRAGIEVTKTGLDTFIFDESNKIKIDLEQVNFDDYSAIIFPGGRRGVNKFYELFLNDNQTPSLLGKQLIEYENKGQLVAAICAAPSLLGRLGILKKRNYTCYPGFENEDFQGIYLGEKVVKDKNLITARSMYYSVDFGLEIVEYLLGAEIREKIENQVKGIQ